MIRKGPRLWLFLVLGSLLLSGSCYRKPPTRLVENIPPETYLFLEGTIDTVGARQHLYWFGNDPDGEVVGFWLAIDDSTPQIFTRRNDSTFVFSSDSTVIIHTFYVWAEDNEGALDPTPASLTLPVINTPPTVNFVAGTLPKDTTFPVATFSFEGHDEDGDHTIEGYLLWLDTDSQPQILDPAQTSITLYDIPPGERTVYIQAFDEAGALSDTLRHTWFVQPVVGQVLLVDDDPETASDQFYRDFFDSQGIPYSVWKVWDGLPPSPIDINAVINELGFTTILWYTGTETQLEGATVPLTDFIQDSSHKLILTGKSVLLVSQEYFTHNVLHVDTVTAWNTIILPITPLIAQVPGIPDTLTLSAPILDRVDGFEPDSLAEALYRFTETAPAGPAALALRYPAGDQARLFVFTFPLDQMNGNGNIPQLLFTILGNGTP